MRAGDHLLHTETRRIDVLAYNEWSRAGSPQMLAAHVLPNHPAVAELLVVGKTQLERLTGNPSLDGYQSGDPNRVVAMAQAIYETLQSSACPGSGFSCLDVPSLQFLGRVTGGESLPYQLETSQISDAAALPGNVRV